MMRCWRCALLVLPLAALSGQDAPGDCTARARIPVGVRPYGPLAWDNVVAACGVATGGAGLAALRRSTAPWVGAWVNSARAADISQGPLWEGRGVTVAASAGVAGRRGRRAKLSYALRPVAFWSQNAAYRPSWSVSRASPDYTNPWQATIDKPYRFGDASYGRLDLGESYARLDVRRVGIGVSNEAQAWGPAHLMPLLMSGDASGFPHAFLETSLPINIGVGRATGRYVLGTLAASGYGPAHAGTSRRLVVGAVVSWLPSGLRGLELGAGRLYHLYDVPGARDFVTASRPFSELFKYGIDYAQSGPDANNQLASVFLRIAPPASGLEVYGEYLRDDHNVDARDLTVEPDHSSAYMVGIRRTVSSGDGVSTLTLETSNARPSHLARVRGQGVAYTHSPIVEGHTQRGLPLGAPNTPGGGGVMVRWRRVAAGGAWNATAAVIRTGQNTEGGSWNGANTGYHSVGVAREFQRNRKHWHVGIEVQPGFGDVPGTNVRIAAVVSR